MALFYIDSDFKCYKEFDEGRILVQSEFFNDKCKSFLEGHRFIPQTYCWTSESGEEIWGEAVIPMIDSAILDSYQQGYNDNLQEIEDLKMALKLFEVEEVRS